MANPKSDHRPITHTKVAIKVSAIEKGDQNGDRLVFGTPPLARSVVCELERSLSPFSPRVYFAADHDEHRIIIGHCGDHLDTAGTRKSK
jgi:hypothetical protein